MKTLLTLLILASTFVSNAQYDDSTRIVNPFYEFEEGSTEILYGDNVVLRKKASKEAAAVDTLAIGTEVKILKKTKETIEVNGRESVWYKVSCEAGTGYIAGGFIALDAKEMNGGLYMVIIAGNEEAYMARCRYLKDGEYYGKETKLFTLAFQLQVYDDRGVEGLESMAVIDLLAEACGVDGGKIYLFNDGERLIEAIACAEVSDGGVFWFSEELQFPDDIGWGNHIRYKREFGEPMDEDMTWTRSIVHEVLLEWKEDHLEPDISTFDFGEEE